MFEFQPMIGRRAHKASIFWHIVVLEIPVVLEIQHILLQGWYIFRTSRVFLKTGQLFYMWPIMKAETRIISVERYSI
jgi:hypothetical protein